MKTNVMYQARLVLIRNVVFLKAGDLESTRDEFASSTDVKR